MHECPPILLNNRYLVFILKGFYWMQNNKKDSTFMGSYIFQFSLETFEDVWRRLKTFEDVWRLLKALKAFEEVWRLLKSFEEFLWLSKAFDETKKFEDF